ncbi:hypothetical protein ACSNN7_26260 [Micromonospora sp. URMC 105]|uniref:hypothetical protein n=1 Tax=Micromonospora sp. URMC 105 TaxID=3423413 RepID=UPI003F194272
MTRRYACWSGAEAGASLPTVDSPKQLGSLLLNKRAAADLLTALQQDRLAGWVAANPDRLTTLGAQR